jgi:peptidoglycan/xylan/chitin deacetylase (PgdA/CDA1 family)
MRALIALAFTVAAAAFPAGPARAQGAGAACWSPGELAHHAGDERVQKRAKAALVAPPKRALADYSPVEQRGVVRRVKLPPGKKLVALTFDLCEQPTEVAGYQGGIVDFLRQNRIKATFFMGGKWMLSHRERTQQLMSDGLFETANHAWEHRNLRNLAGTALTSEIKNAQLAYEQVREELEAKQCLAPGSRRMAAEQAPKRLGYFRFPFGACSPQALSEVADMGLLPIQWDVSSGDPASALSASAMAQNVLEAVRPGSIVLFHANGRGRHTEAALPDIVAALKAKGFQFVTVTELLAAGEPVMSATCYDSRPGDVDQPRFPHPAVAANRGQPNGEVTGGVSRGPLSLFPWPR